MTITKPFKTLCKVPSLCLFAASLLLLPLLSASDNPLSQVLTRLRSAESAQMAPGLSATSTQIPSGSLEQVDWSNFTYTFTCYTEQPVNVRVNNGSSHMGYVYYSVAKPVFGDLTGDGQPEAVIPFQCAAADSAPAQAFVYTGNAEHPILLAILPMGGERPLLSVRSASIVNGALLLSGDGYMPHDPLCCPSLHTTTTYRWNGTNIIYSSSQSSLIETPAP